MVNHAHLERRSNQYIVKMNTTVNKTGNMSPVSAMYLLLPALKKGFKQASKHNNDAIRVPVISEILIIFFKVLFIIYQVQTKNNILQINNLLS
jgi:hypothetical protein